MSAEAADAYETQLNRAATGKESRFVSAATELAYRQLAEEVRKANATPIFLITPTLTQTKLEFRPESGIANAVMSFNDAKAYPQLYRKEMRADSGHLNKVAAEEFTRLVAESLRKFLHEKRGPVTW